MLSKVHAKVPLPGHHVSGVRKGWYRTGEDLAKHYKNNPVPHNFFLFFTPWPGNIIKHNLPKQYIPAVALAIVAFGAV